MTDALIIITLALMMLVTVVSVGLLGLAAVSLRSASQGIAQAEARANARRILLVGKPDLNMLLDAEMKYAQLRQAGYAEATNYGTLPEKQVAWEQQILAELQELQAYQATEQ